MFALTLDNLPVIIVFVVLAGSLLGSTLVFVFGGNGARLNDDEGYSSSGYRRPADWPTRQTGMATYQPTGAAEHRALPRRSSLLAAVFVAGLAFVGGSAGVFAYKSDWPIDTDLRHLAASLHCDLAERVGLASAPSGTPGYHIRNDRDGNGIACESYAPALDLFQGQVAPMSTTQLTWPAAMRDAAVPASQ